MDIRHKCLCGDSNVSRKKSDCSNFDVWACSSYPDCLSGSPSDEDKKAHNRITESLYQGYADVCKALGQPILSRPVENCDHIWSGDQTKDSPPSFCVKCNNPKIIYISDPVSINSILKKVSRRNCLQYQECDLDIIHQDVNSLMLIINSLQSKINSVKKIVGDK